MAKSRAKKEQEVQAFVDGMSQSKATIFVRFSGIPVKKEQELRTALKKDGNEYAAIKKTLLKLAFSGLKQNVDELGDTSGSIAAAFGTGDEVSVAKALYTFAKAEEGMELIGGFYNGAIISKSEVEALATLPSKEELVAKVVYLIGHPLRGLVQVMNGPDRGLVQVLSALQEKKA